MGEVEHAPVRLQPLLITAARRFLISQNGAQVLKYVAAGRRHPLKPPKAARFRKRQEIAVKRVIKPLASMRRLGGFGEAFVESSSPWGNVIKILRRHNTPISQEAEEERPSHEGENVVALHAGACRDDIVRNCREKLEHCLINVVRLRWAALGFVFAKPHPRKQTAGLWSVRVKLFPMVCARIETDRNDAHQPRMDHSKKGALSATAERTPQTP